jgi:hypothetical protein
VFLIFMLLSRTPQGRKFWIEWQKAFHEATWILISPWT